MEDDLNFDLTDIQSGIIPAASFAHVSMRFVGVPQPLIPFVQSLWFLEGAKGNEQYFTEKLYPNASCSLTFQLDAAGCVVRARQHYCLVRQQWDASACYIGVVFKPGAFKSLFGLSPASESDDKLPFIPLRSHRFAHYDSLNTLCDTLENMDATLSPSVTCGRSALKQQVLMVKSWLLELITNADTVSFKWQPLLNIANAQLLSPAQLAKECAMSRRTLERHMRKYFNVTPHQFFQYSQLRKARELLLSNHYTLSDIALACAYYDQAHFTHVFSRSTFETPNHYRRRKLSQIYN
ncbi:helix-turn-helix transcriptional regulator [Alteromonas gracilis]|uniref:helix-turn-helix transcriptional regulator n=1 Tax=Alteromonas gracilis TaxID=1479524 RepID=UPI003219BB7C